MSAEEEGLEDDDIRLPYVYDAVVVDDADPDGHGRVRVRIEGVLDEGSDWAWPVATAGGGKARRGFFNVPEVGSTVAVYFNQGDPAAPRYMGGFWAPEVDGAGDEGGVGSELPTRARDVPVQDRKRIKVLETERWAVVLDDRETPKNDAGEPVDDPANPANGQDTFLILHKESGATIEVDGGRRGITISAIAGVRILSDGLIEIDGSVVQIAGRKVMRTGGAIT